MTNKQSAEKAVSDIRRATRRKYSAEGKIRIVLEGPRGEDSVVELCRKEGINSNVYYRWSFLEAGKKRLSGDEVSESTSDEVKQLRTELGALYWKELHRYNGSETQTIERVKNKYFNQFIDGRDVHFFVGTYKGWDLKYAPNTFMITGVFSPPIVFQEELF